MNKPLLQIALDNFTLEDALRCLENGMPEVVDIIEVGTMLIQSEGFRVINIIRAFCPGKLIVADDQLMLTHFGSKVLSYGAQLNTLLSVADDTVKEQILAEAKSRGQIMQIELYPGWKMEDVDRWKAMGYDHLIYTRPYVRTGPWTKDDAETVKLLCDKGWNVTVTGSITLPDLDIFAGLPIYAVISGKSIRNAPDPVEAAKAFQARLAELWN